MIYNKKNEIFHFLIKGNEEYDEKLVIKTFVLLFRCFGDYSISDTYEIESFKNLNMPWPDLVLGNFKIASENGMGIKINIPFWVQKKESVNQLLLAESISLFYGRENGETYIGVDFYASVFTDKNYMWIEGQYEEVEFALAAKKNRDLLSAFIRDLEVLYKGEVVEYSSYYIDSRDQIYKYGIKAEAQLNYGQET